MRAMVLAAGLGSRLFPLTATTPKPLLDVAGRPLIHYALALLANAGITEVAINLHHLGDRLRAALGDGSDYGMHFEYFVEQPLLDTGGAIANARSFLGNGPFVVVNSDTITDLDLGAMLRLHAARGATATMMLREDPEVARYGAIGVDGDGRVRSFLGKRFAAGDEEPLRSLMFGGVHIFEPRVFDYLDSGVFSITRVTYPRLLASGEWVQGFEHAGFWRVLDTPAGLAAGRIALSHILAG